MAYVRTASGLNVHYDMVGSGPPLVLVHGMLAHMGNWHFKLVPMLWHDFTVLTYDLRGHGYTEMTETGYTPTQLAGDLKELLDVLGLERVDLVGHSMGADIILYFCYLYPERVNRAVLIEPLVPAKFRFLTREDFDGRAWIADVLEKFGVPIPDERRLDEEFLLKRAFGGATTRWGPLRGLPRRKKHMDWMEKLLTTTSITKDVLEVDDLTLDAFARITPPIHLISDSGSYVWYQSFAFLRDTLPNVTWEVLKTSSDEMSHFAPLEKPEVIGKAILDYLRVPVSST